MACRRWQRFFDCPVMHRNFFDTPANCVRTMHDKPGSVFRVNRGQQEASLATDMLYLYGVTW